MHRSNPSARACCRLSLNRNTTNAWASTRKVIETSAAPLVNRLGLRASTLPRSVMSSGRGRLGSRAWFIPDRASVTASGPEAVSRRTSARRVKPERAAAAHGAAVRSRRGFLEPGTTPKPAPRIQGGHGQRVGVLRRSIGRITLQIQV